MQENSNSIRVLNAAMVNGYSIVTFQRPLRATDKFDLPIVANRSQAIVWAVGPLNQRQEVSYHSLYTRGDRFIQFGREPVWNCPLSDTDMKMIDDNMEEFYNPNKGSQQEAQQNFSPNPNFRPTNNQNFRPTENQNQNFRPTNNNNNQNFEPSDEPEVNRRPQNPSTTPSSRPQSVASRPKNKYWDIPPIQCWEPEDGVFYAQMGPTGGKQGYPAITGTTLIY